MSKKMCLDMRWCFLSPPSNLRQLPHGAALLAQCRTALQLLALPAPHTPRSAAACESRPAALPSARRPALQPAPSCPAARASCCLALNPACRPAQQLVSRTALPCSPARRALLPCPACRALQPCASRPAAARTSHLAALRVTPCCSPRVLPYCSSRVALCCPAPRADLPNPGRAALPRSPAPPSRLAATTAAAAARATAAACGGAAGSADGAGGAGGATESAGGGAGAGGAGPTTDRCCLSWPLSRQLQRLGVDSGGRCLSWTTPPFNSFASGFFSEPVQVVEALVFCILHRGGSIAAALGASESPAALGASESTTALGASESAATLGASESAAAPDASESAAALGARASSATGPSSDEALHTFTLDSGTSRCFFRDCTALTPLAAPVPVSLADPTGGPVVARASTVLPCPAVTSGSQSGLHLPTFLTNLTGRHLATFTQQPGSSLYTLTTASAQVAEADPGIEAAALVASESALLGTVPAEALHTFTLDSDAAQRFFRDNTTLTPLSALVPVRLADPSGGPVLTCSSTVLPCPAVPSGSLSGLHLPSFSTKLASTAALQDAMVTTTTPGGQRVSIYTCTRMGRHLATFTRRRGSSLYILATKPPHVAASAQVLHASSHSSSFPPTTAPLQTLHMDVWGPACVSGQGRERYFLLVVDDYTRYTTVFPLQSKVQRFCTDLPVLRLHSDRGGEFSSDLLRDFCRGEGILKSFTLPDSPQQNGIAERRIGLVMEVARTSMIHAAAPHFIWPFAVWYAAHQLNLWPCVPLPETLPTMRWTGKVGDASVFRVWGSRAFVRDTSADKLSAHAIPYVFLVFSPDAPGWQFYHPTSRRVFPSHDVTSDESVPFYRLFPYHSAPSPPPSLFLAPGPPPVDTLPPQGPAPSGVSQVDPLPGTAPVEPGGAEFESAEPERVESEGAGSGGAGPGGAECEGAGSGGAVPWVAEPGGAEPARVEPGGIPSGGAESRGNASSGGPAGAPPRLSPRPEPLSPHQLRKWFARRTLLQSGAIGAGDSAAMDTRAGSARITAGAGGTGGAAAAGPGGARTRGTGAVGTSGVGGARAGTLRSFELLGLEELELLALELLTIKLEPASPLPAHSPYNEQTGGLTERREHASCPASRVRTGRRVPRPRPPLVPGTNALILRPPYVPLRVPLLPSSESSLPADRQEDFECRSAAVTRFASILLAPEGNLDAPAILTQHSYAKAITGPYSSHLQAAMDAKMASWKCTATYVGAVPPSQANIVNGMWIFGGVDYFQTFFPTPKMSNLRVLLHVAAQPDYELHSLDFSTAFLHGSLHEEILLRRPRGFTGSLPAGTQWSLRRPVYGLLQVPHEWHDRLRTTLATLGFTPSTANPSLFLRNDTSLPPFYVLVTSSMGLVLGGRGPVVLTGHADASWVDGSATQWLSQGYTFSLGSDSVSWRSTRSSLVLISSCEAETYAGAMAAQELCLLTYLLTDLGERTRSPSILYADNKAMIALCQEHRLKHRTKHIALQYFLARELQQRGQYRLPYVATTDIFTKALPP
ncbi:unnamed protein product [Closterium sp. NIES-54]